MVESSYSEPPPERGMIWLLFEIAVAIVVERLVNGYFPSLQPYAWLAILVGFTYKSLESRFVRPKITKFYAQRGKKRPVLSYIVVGLIGAGILCFYWWGVSKAFVLLEKHKADNDKNTDSRATSSPSPEKTTPFTVARDRLKNHPESLTLFNLMYLDFDPQVDNEIQRTSAHEFIIKLSGGSVYGTAFVISTQRDKQTSLAFYLPSSTRTAVATAFIADHCRESLNTEITNKNAPFAGDVLPVGWEFSGRVYIYHETVLAPEEVAFLIEYGRSKRVEFFFRGLNYLRNKDFPPASRGSVSR